MRLRFLAAAFTSFFDSLGLRSWTSYDIATAKVIPV